MVLEKEIYGRRRSGREPGRWASSRPVSESPTSGGGVACVGSSETAVGALGWLMEFCPVIIEPSARPAEMWCVKLLTTAGSTAVRASSTRPMTPRR